MFGNNEELTNFILGKRNISFGRIIFNIIASIIVPVIGPIALPITFFELGKKRLAIIYFLLTYPLLLLLIVFCFRVIKVPISLDWIPIVPPLFFWIGAYIHAIIIRLRIEKNLTN